MDLTGVDLVLERPVDVSKVKRALQGVLSVPTEKIAVIYDIAQYPSREAAEVVCVVSTVGGDFGELLSIQTEHISIGCDDMVEFAQRVCSNLGVRCLMPLEGSNPYLMWLLSPDAPPEQVALDVSELDEDRYVVRTPKPA